MNRKDKKQHTVKKKRIIINTALTITLNVPLESKTKKIPILSLLCFRNNTRLPTAPNTLILTVITLRRTMWANYF